ncbi:retrovirus-related Pol polyprotein from transposon TNT 1-94 [Trichonephila clavipes]|nr:retrovirus-related Pol polyprotein from transposon TNT 1-94 [Trichonephila clavipes]
MLESSSISCKDKAATRLQEAGHKLDDLYIGFQLIRWLPSGIPVYRATNLQMERRGLSELSKIEAELILEANRLQLMKQDLEKGECLLEQFHLKKVEDVTWCYFWAAAFMEIQMTIMITKRKVVSKNDSVKGLPRLNDNGKTHCIPCKLAKSKRVSFKKTGAVRSKRPLELLAYGPLWSMPTESRGGEKIIPNPRFSDLSEQQALMVEVTIPNCYKQAIRSRDASKWHDAMDKEINVMKERKVWDLVDHPDNIKIFRKPLGFIPLNMMKIIKLLDTRPA